MSLFKKLGTDNLEKEKDVLGGGRKVLPSDIYKGVIKYAYATQAESGALGLVLSIALESGEEYTETVWVSTKTGDNFYTDKNGKKRGLPGFTIANDLALIAAETELCNLGTEEKVIKVYDYNEKGEINRPVPMLMDLVGKPVAVGILEEKSFKQTKADNGSYVDSDETVSKNRLSKIFHPELKLTVPEAMEGKEAVFWDAWIEANKGKVIDRTQSKGKAAPSASGAKQGGTSTPKKSSLFPGK